MTQRSPNLRFFKTTWFSKAARKARLTDEELCLAIQQVILGQVDDLGGGVFKKRLGKNLYRSIILTRTGTFWIYEYVFAKKDRANIESDELIEFRKLVKQYERLSDRHIDELLSGGFWKEICDGDTA